MKRTFYLSLGVLFVLVACAQVDKTAEQNKAVAARFVNEVWNVGNLAVADEVLAAEFVRHNPASWEPAQIEGIEAFKQYATQIHDLYPDFKVEVTARIAEGDLVATRWTVTGTNAQAQKQISIDGMSFDRFADGKIAEEWASWDTQGLEQQLGTEENETTMK